MSELTISLCMIAKNEGDNLRRCLDSINSEVDQIILVDTGSSDQTVEIAREYGAVVIEEEWENDFSSHRNSALKVAGSDWILFLDCDEELAPASRGRVKEIIEDDNYEAYYLDVVNKVEDDAEISFPSIRLFKNREEYRFQGRIHEQIIYSILERVSFAEIGDSGLKINHYGYNPQTNNIQAKTKRNLAILEDYKEEEQDGFYFYNLGTEYLRAGHQEKALKAYQKSLQLTEPGSAYSPFLVKRLVNILMGLEHYREVLKYLDYYQEIYPSFADLYFLEGICQSNLGRYTEAQVALQQYLILADTDTKYPKEERIGGYSGKELLAAIEGLALVDNYPSLTVCIIGKNEGVKLKRAIKSINELAREVLYFDTGSEDNSCSMAYQMMAKVYKLEWKNDFAEIRNFALKQAEGEWILMIDADELLPDQSRLDIVKLLQEAKADAYILKIYNYLDQNFSLQNCYLTGGIRLFKNYNYYYQGTYGEEIKSSILQEGSQIARADIAINHLHYLANPAEIQRKHQQKLRVIKNSLEEGSIKQLYSLGVEYFYAHQFDLAREYFSELYLMLGQEDEETWADLYYFYGLLLLNLKGYEESLEVLEVGSEKYPDYSDLFYLQGVIYYIQGDFKKSTKLFNQCLELRDAPWYKYTITKGAGTFKAMTSLAAIYLKEDKELVALELYLKLVEIPVSYAEGIEGITRIYLAYRNLNDLEGFLTEKDLLEGTSLAIIANLLAKLNYLSESLEYLEKSYEYLKKGEYNGDYLAGTIEELVIAVGRNLFKDSDEDKQLIELINRYQNYSLEV